MARPDLLALTEDGLVQLFNAGLVKRAARDIEGGAGPALAETDDGVIEARFPDGVLTRLAPGRAAPEASCSCPAAAGCRHRVMLALAYRAQKQTKETDADAEAPAAPWDPAALDADAFEAALSPAAKTELARLLAGRIDVRLERGAVPAAKLPMATVRFLAPDDLGYAACDCATGRRCAHVAVAIRAFKASGGADAATVGFRGADVPSPAVDDLRQALDAALARLIEVGVAAGPAAHAETLARAARAAEAARATQVALAVDALAEQIAAYEARSARYDELVAFALATELYARPRAGDARLALGVGEAFETPMGKARLVSLGARLRAEGEQVRAELLFADSDTGATMLLEKHFSPLPNERGRLAESIGKRQLAPGLALSAAAHGQILTAVARRRADGLLTLGAGHGGRTGLMPRAAVFAFAKPLAAPGVEDVVERFERRPPAFLRPRRRIGDVHVFDVESVLGQAWSPGDQIWRAAVALADDGGTLHLERAYDAAAPGAIDALASAFAGADGALRQVAGPVRVEGGALVCEPWSLGAERFVAPDLAATADALPHLSGDASGPSTPLETARRSLAGLVHAGRRGGRADVAALLEAAGYRETAARLNAFASATAGDVEAFGRAAVWVACLFETKG